MATIERYGSHGIIRDYDSGVILTYEKTSPRDFNLLRPQDKFDWDNDSYSFGDYFIHPYGYSNDLPNIIKNVIFENYIAPGLLNKKTNLLWGQGPKLYQEKFITDADGKTLLIREGVDDKEIEAWLDTWDYEQYLHSQCVDYHHMGGCFTTFVQNRGGRIGGTPFFAELKHLPLDRVRLASSKLDEDKKPEYAIVTDYSFNSINSQEEYRVYPVFNFKNPFDNPLSVYYSNTYSFCMDYYTVPEIYGALEWLRRSTAVPVILKALSDNSLNIKYHIISPQKYWDQVEARLKKKCEAEHCKYQDSMLTDFEMELFQKITRVLGGNANVGKIWHTKKILEIDGTNLLEHGWEIKTIDQNIDSFVTANLEISKRADYAVTSAIGLHPAIANISDSGKANGGSEQVYALQGYLLSGIDIPEMIVTKAINYALRANFPRKRLKMGMYHTPAQKQSDISPQNRIKEISPNE
jgi:hypothetical protein